MQRWMLAKALVLLACLVVLLGLAGSGSIESGATVQAKRTIASATAGEFRAVLVATKESSDGGAPTATVRLSAYERVDGSWRRLGAPLRVGRQEGFFWYVVTGPHALGRLSISTNTPERVEVKLLITPSIGWSKLYRFQVEDGELTRG